MTDRNNPHQGQPIRQIGADLAEMSSAMILIHGRGASAEDILLLAQELPHPGMAYLAPQASGNTWYPYSFLSPIAQNEPGITSGLQVIADLLDELAGRGIPPERVVLAGFSQGACLTSEFIARRPQRYGGALIFSGGVIGPPDMARQDEGDLAGTPIFIGCGDPDSHIPRSRVEETAVIFQQLGGDVVTQIYPGMGHTINQAEIEQARAILARLP
jgi:predicted esterase